FDANMSPLDRQKSKQIKNTKNLVNKIGFGKSAVFREADRVVESARGLDISAWTEAELDSAMNMVSDAHKILFKERICDGFI
ncbi:MAG: hypothetical protein WAO55_01155, partial [Candidatus Manganitrophaceae bacterium]